MLNQFLSRHPGCHGIPNERRLCILLLPQTARLIISLYLLLRYMAPKFIEHLLYYFRRGFLFGLTISLSDSLIGLPQIRKKQYLDIDDNYLWWGLGQTLCYFIRKSFFVYILCESKSSYYDILQLYYLLHCNIRLYDS